MPAVIVSDTSCLIALTSLNRLDLLHQIFGQIIITPIIQQEYGLVLPGWVSVKSFTNERFFRYLCTMMDEGEASAIAYAFEQSDALVLIDDWKGRKAAQQLDLNITGTLGLLVLAKEKGVLSAVKPIIDELSKINFRMSEKAILETLLLAGER